MLLPILADIVRQHPDLRLSLSFTDRIIDPVEEQVDLVIRFGETPDTTGLITRKLAEQRVPLVAAPGYVAQRGMPLTPEDLSHHACVTGVRRDVPIGYRLTGPDGRPRRLSVTPTHEVGDGKAVVDAAIAGLGIAQMPWSLVAGALADGRLIEVLPDHATATVSIHALWPETRHLLARVRHVVDTLAVLGRNGACESRHTQDYVNTMDVSHFITGVDLLGTFVFGLSGSIVAIRHRLDVFGVIVLSVAAALAGGMLRDMLLGATPVIALADERYLLVALAAALVAFFCKPVISRLGKPVMVFDALGLGLFAVTGCRKGLQYGLDPVASVLLGVLTAVGGGLVRDLLVAEIPRVLREEIYALAAFVGATVVVIGEYLEMAGWLVTLVGVAAAFLLRVVSVIYGWSAPRSPWP